MKNKTILTREELEEMDKTMQIIPLTYDFMFKNVFTDDLDILKEFLILETGLRLNPNDTKISILNGELPKENYKEYKKTIDIYISLNDKICIDVYISVFYGYNVSDIAYKVQENVKNSISSMVDIEIDKVNIHVMSVVFEKEEVIE